MFTKNFEYEMPIAEIARSIGSDMPVSIGVCKNEPCVGKNLNCASYRFLENDKGDYDIAVAPQSGVEVKSVKAIAEGLSLVWAMKPTCVDDVGPYPYVIASRICDTSFKIAPAVNNFLCNVAFTTERPEVGKGGNLMVVHFHRTFSDHQLMTPIRIDSFEEVVYIGKGLAWVRVSNANQFSLDFFVKFPTK